MSTVCLKVFTDSVPSFWHIETAWGGLKNEPQPTATISDIDPPLRHVSQELCSYILSHVPPAQKAHDLASKKIQALYAKVLNLHYFGLHGEMAESGQAVRSGTGNVNSSVTALSVRVNARLSLGPP